MSRWKPAVLRAAGMAAIVLVAVAAITGPLDSRAEQAAEAGMKRALASFALARGLNAVISAVQGTEISFAPVGVGVTLTPGEVLDPVNDLIERFSSFMLVSAVALGAQRVLIEFSGWLPFSLALVAVLAAIVLNQLFAGRLSQEHRRWLRTFAVLLLVLRFAIPVAAIGSEWMYGQFLAERHDRSAARLADARDEVDAINRSNAPLHAGTREKGLLDRVGEWADSARERVNAAADLDRYKAAVSQTVQDAVELIVVFLLHTLVLPFAILMLLWWMAKRLLLPVVQPPAGSGLTT